MQSGKQRGKKTHLRRTTLIAPGTPHARPRRYAPQRPLRHQSGEASGTGKAAQGHHHGHHAQTDHCRQRHARRRRGMETAAHMTITNPMWSASIPPLPVAMAPYIAHVAAALHGPRFDTRPRAIPRRASGATQRSIHAVSQATARPAGQTRKGWSVRTGSRRGLDERDPPSSRPSRNPTGSTGSAGAASVPRAKHIAQAARPVPGRFPHAGCLPIGLNDRATDHRASEVDLPA